MKNLYNEKNKKMYEILFIVKITSLLFSGLALLTYLFSDKINTSIITFISIFIIFTLILIIIYSLFWLASLKQHKYNKNIIYLFENIIFITIFFIIIHFTGAYESDYKVIYLFIIIISTIQSGLINGMIISIISSILILFVDIMCAPNLIVNKYFENDLIMVAIFMLTAWTLGYYVKMEKDHINQLEGLVNLDGLTELYNHRFFHDALTEEIKFHTNNNRALSLIFLDIDNFKHYNDINGHQMGDGVLKKVGSLLKSKVRINDIVARYGGEEFAIILPNTDEDNALLIAEGIRKTIEKADFHGEENQPNKKLTVSLGIATYPKNATNEIELIKSADDALYRAKFFNKNRVEVYTSILDELIDDIEEEHIDIITSIKTLISVINAKDKYTYGHVERVVMYSRLLGNKLQLDENTMANLIYGAYMHDIGKINIPESVLNKKMPLNEEEWNLLKQHPKNGIEIIKSVPSLKEVAPLILHHHERYDGKGYPSYLKGKDIPYLARILTIVDSFDAITFDRPYNTRKTFEEAIVEIQRCSGTQFDPEIAKVFIDVINENECIFNNVGSLDKIYDKIREKKII